MKKTSGQFVIYIISSVYMWVVFRFGVFSIKSLGTFSTVVGSLQCAIKQISFSIWFFIYDNCETVTDIRRKIPSFQLTIAWLFFVRFIFEDARQFSCALQFYKMDNCLHPEIYARSLCNFLHKNAHCNSDNLCDFDSFSWNPIGNLDLRK